MNRPLLISALIFLSATFAMHGAAAPSAPELLKSSATAVTPNFGDHVTMWAAWTEHADTAVPLEIAPAQFEMSIGGENYTLNVGPVEGSLSKGLTSDYANPDGDVWGRYEQVWGDSRGNFGVMIAKADGSTPWDAWDYGFTRGTSRTETPTSLPADYYRFHFVNDVVTRVGVVEKIDATGHVLASGTYHAQRFNDNVTYSEHATVTWFKDGQKLTRHDTWGYGSPDWFDIPSFSASDAGTYTLHVENSKGSLDVSFVVSAPPRSSLVDISSRAYCSNGNKVTIGGYVISGDVPKRILVRAVGPSLTSQGIGVAEVLPDPTIELHDAINGNVVINTNDNWSENGNAAEITAVSKQFGASALADGDTKSAALLITLKPGVYSFVAGEKTGKSGVVLIEVYDVDSAPSNTRFADISARAYCGTGNNVAIGGFVISGTVPKQVLLRAVGPTLAEAGLGQTEVLVDPVIELHDASHGNVVIKTNDNWGDNPNAAAIVAVGARIGATPFSAADTKSSALLLTLQPGVYSFVASGKNDGAGVVLVEVYDAD